MSFDNVGGTGLVLDNPGLLYVDGVSPPVEGGTSLVEALALLGAASSDNDAVLQPSADTLDLDEGVDPSLIVYEPDMPTDSGGDGYIEIYEPAIYVPQGFVADDLYAVEFILDPATGVLTINFLFSTDPLDHQLSLGASSSSAGPMTEAFAIGSPDLGDATPAQAPANGSKCTVVLTKTTTQTSGSSTVSFLGGLINYTMNSGSSSTTTTKTISVDGHMVNGRCVVNGDKG